MLGCAEVSWTIPRTWPVSRAAALADSAFWRASVVSESYWRAVRIRSIGTRAESGSSRTSTCAVSSDWVASSAWLKSTRTVMESTDVALRGRGGTVSCGNV